MSEALIRAQIKTILETASGIGAVYDYERYARSLGDYFALMTKTGQTTVNGWIIHRERTVSAPITLGIKGQIERIHTFRIAGLYEMDDSAGSEKTFQGILDAIFEAFRANPTLNATATRHDQIQIDDVTVCIEDEYGGNLYHVAECTLNVTERVNVTT
jgi:hypothetical protein